MRDIKSRLARLEAITSPPEIEWLTITPEMTDAQAAQTYYENLRRCKAGYVHPKPTSAAKPDTGLQDDSAYMQCLFNSPAPTHRSTD